MYIYIHTYTSARMLGQPHTCIQHRLWAYMCMAARPGRFKCVFMCVYVLIYVYMYIYIHICTYAWAATHLHSAPFVSLHVHGSATCTVQMCMYVCICAYICIYIYIHIYIYTHMHICLHSHTLAFSSKSQLACAWQRDLHGVDVYVCVYIHKYIHTYIHAWTYPC